jgi:hypothetical protein
VNQDSFWKMDGCFLRLTSLFVPYNEPALRASHAYSDLKINSSVFQKLPCFTTRVILMMQILDLKIKKKHPSSKPL